MSKKSNTSTNQLKINFNSNPRNSNNSGKVININQRLDNINRNSITKAILRNTKSF